MSSSNCTSELIQCELTFPPLGSASYPTSQFLCPAGTYITKLTSGECTQCGNPYVGCIHNVTCSDGTILVPTVGNCTTDTNEIVSDCSGTHAGVAGFGGRSGSSFDVMTVICGDGTPAATPTFHPSGGTQFTTQFCPNQTHRMGSITATTNSNRVYDINATCIPLQNICTGATLNDPACFDFCNSNTGSCDSELLSYCSDPTNYTKPICGCALPSSQYATLNLISQSSGISLPTACAAECAASTAIKLAKSGTCNVGTICVQSNIDITAVQSQLGGGITLTQNCGNSSNSSSTTNNFFTSSAFYIILAIIVVLLIVIIILFLVTNNNKNKRLEEERREELRRRAAAAERPQVIRL